MGSSARNRNATAFTVATPAPSVAPILCSRPHLEYFKREPIKNGEVFHEELAVTRDEARTFAEQWAADWNEMAVERVLAHFDDQVLFTSPTALAVVGVATVCGKEALRQYWNAAVAQVRSLRFTVDRVVWDADTRELAIIYDAEIDGRTRRVSENLTFGADGHVISAEVFHGVFGKT